MKRLPLILLVYMLLLTACSDTETYRLRGILYTDSTLTTPIPNATLTFGSGEWYWNSTNLPIDTLGQAVTDVQGRWGIAYNVAIDPIARGQWINEYMLRLPTPPSLDDMPWGTNIRTDLGLNSLELVNLAVEIEEEFDVEIPDREAMGLETVADAIRIIEEYM